MSSHYKEAKIKNGRGTTLVIDPESYLSVGPGGIDVTVRGDGKVIAFDNWADFVNALDTKKSAYHNSDNPET